MRKMLIFTVIAIAIAFVMAPVANAREVVGAYHFEVEPGGSIIAEGSTIDAYETTITFTNPTADRAIVVPDATGTLLLSGNALSGTTLTTTGAGVIGTTLAVGGAIGYTDGILISSGDIISEGATQDAYETTITFSDTTSSDKTITMPDATGTVLLSTGGIAQAANALWGANNSIVAEGSAADAFDTTLNFGGATGSSKTATLPDQTGTFILSPAGAVGVTSAVSGVTGGFEAEGATADAFETTLTFEDPDVDTAVTIPAALYAGTIVPVMGLGADATTYTITNSTADAQSLTIASGTFSAGKMVRITFAGTVVGTNAAKSVNLYVDDGIHGTLTIAAGTAGDFVGTFVIAEHTDFANQSIYGTLQTVVPADGFADFVTDTTDFNDGGDTVVKLQIISGHGSDSIQIFHSFAELIQ